MADEASGPGCGNEVQRPDALRAWHEDRHRVAKGLRAAGDGRLIAGEPGQRRPGRYPPAS